MLQCYLAAQELYQGELPGSMTFRVLLLSINFPRNCYKASNNNNNNYCTDLIFSA